MKNDDAELIQDTLAGDNTAFSELVKKYQKQVHALAWRKIGDFHTAEDITQDTFLKAYQRLHTLKEPQKFAGWLYVIATRRCLAWFRKKRLWHQTLENIDTPRTDKDAFSKHVAEEQAKTTDKAQQEVVKKLLETLKESDRTVITLHYFGEMTCEEISEFLGVSANTIKSRLRRARNRMKKEEPMIREAISNFQISPYLTDNIMQEISRLKPATPSVSKPLMPWVAAASSVVLIVLMLGIGSQYLASIQKPFNLDAQTEWMVEIVDAQIVQDIDAKPNVRNKQGKLADTDGKNTGDGEKANQVSGDEGDHTQWNLPEKATARLAKGRIKGIAFSPDGTQIAVGSATGVWIYDARTGAELALLTDHISPTGEVVFSPDGKTLATGLTSKILLWHIPTGKLLKTFKKEEGSIKALRIIDNGKTLRCNYKDGSVRLWDITTGVKKDFHPTPSLGLRGLSKYIQEQEVKSAALYLNNFDNKGIFAVGEIDGKIRLDDAITGRQLKTLQGHKDTISKLAFSPDGTLLVSKAYNSYPLRLWDVTTGKLLKTITRDSGHFGGHLNFSKDGKTLALKFWDGKIELWDVATKTLRTTIEGNKDGAIAIREFAFSPDSKTVAGTNPNGDVQVWNVNIGEELSSFKTKHTQWVTALTFSQDSSTLASAQGSKLRVWDTFNVTQLSDPIDNVTFLDALVLSPDGRTVKGIEGFRYEVKSSDETVIESVLSRLHVWETRSGDKLSDLSVESHKGDVPELTEHKFSGRFSSTTGGTAAFSKNGVMLASVLNNSYVSSSYPSDNRFTIHLWAVPYAESHTTLKGHTKKINVLAFTPNGKMIASGSDDGTIRLWDTGTGTQTLSIPSSKTNALAFSEDGKILASSNPENIQLWDVDTGTQLTSLKEHSDSATVWHFPLIAKFLQVGVGMEQFGCGIFLPAPN